MCKSHGYVSGGVMCFKMIVLSFVVRGRKHTHFPFVHAS